MFSLHVTKVSSHLGNAILFGLLHNIMISTKALSFTENSCRVCPWFSKLISKLHQMIGHQTKSVCLFQLVSKDLSLVST